MPPLAVIDINALPVELLHLICTAADHDDFYSIALSSRILNEVMTPVLYSTIDLELPHAIYACVRTLVSPPAKAAMNRDLASFVETLSLRDPDGCAGMSALNDYRRFVAGRRLADAVPRMRRLRSITSQIGFPQMFTTLASGALPVIDTVDIKLCFAYLSLGERDAVVEVAPVAAGFPSLKVLKLEWDSDPPKTYASLMCSLLTASDNTLQSLAIRGDPDALESAWHSISSFPALQELDISPDLLTAPAFRDTSSVRRLVMPEDYWWDELELPSGALPHLQDITCFPMHLSTFLPEDAAHRRPISAVTLNHVVYARSRSGGHYAREDRDATHDLLTIWRALRTVRFSSCPLLRLGFAMGDLGAAGMSDLVPYMRDLEYLLIMVEHTEELKAWSEGGGILSLAEMLGQMPHLHTFLLSDALLKTLPDGSPFKFTHDEDYQRRALAAYDQHSSSLRRVAFTTDFEWEKREDGQWHPWGYVRVTPEREIVSDGEEEDELW
ncbi:hypothetical protein C8T65DRAFT_28214 [Cerioporus squamosus]|nr:hypothetical protein C8T65DRAFT_28214 [Cerioporus squamosus]